MGIKIILTGATGMVGEGVLLASLDNPEVENVLMVNRRPFQLTHPKLKELIVPDFFQVGHFKDQLKGYDACFFCAGISSFGMKEVKYTRITYDTTLAFADVLLAVSPGLTFCYISGSHTDSSEKGKMMWARVKGKTENELMKRPFKKEYNFRPGGMVAVPGQKNAKAVYTVLVKIIGLFAPKLVITLSELGDAMINAVTKGYPKQVLEIMDIKALALV